MAAKGQTSIEWLFIVAIVLTAATITLVSYSEESTKTIAETTIRTQVDMILSKARFTNPECQNLKLMKIQLDGQSRYLLSMDPPPGSTPCDPLAVFTPGVQKQIEARVAEALGCKYEETDTGSPCRGKYYIVDIQ